MTTQIAISLSQFLIGLDHVGLVVPVAVQIAKRTYAGVRFAEDIEGVFSEKLYLIGELPPLYRSSQRHLCFRTDEGTDWLLSSWFRHIAAIEYREIHPIGDSHFVLTAFSLLDAWAMEQCGEHVRRLQMSITEVGPVLSNEQYGDEDEEDDDTDDNNDFHQWG